MNTIGLRDAKARLSALVDAAERGEPTTITKNGKPAAVIVPVGASEDAVPRRRKKSFAEHLLSMPDDIPLERDRTPVRAVDL